MDERKQEISMQEGRAHKSKLRSPRQKGSIVENWYMQWKKIPRKDMIVLGCFFIGLIYITIVAAGIILFIQNCCGLHIVGSGKASGVLLDILAG